MVFIVEKIKENLFVIFFLFAVVSKKWTFYTVNCGIETLQSTSTEKSWTFDYRTGSVNEFGQHTFWVIRRVNNFKLNVHTPAVYF